MNELIGLNLLWFAIVFGVTALLHDGDWKEKLTLIVGMELFLSLLTAGIWYLYL